MATTAKARGQITIVDLNDAKQVTAYLENSGADVQIYNPDTKVYTPNYTSAPITLTPKVFMTGSSDDQIKNCTGFAYTVNGVAADGTNYVVTSSTGALTIKANLSSVNFLNIVFTCTFTDPDTAATTKLTAYKTISKSQSAGALFSAVITTPSGTIFDTAQSTTAKTAKCTVYRGGTQDTSGTTYKWYKLDTASGKWTQITSTSSGTTPYITTASNVSTLTVTPDDVLNFQTFKCVATDSSNSSEALVTFQDVTDPYQVELVSTTGDKIVNGSGSTSVAARVYRSGELVESESTATASRKFTYTWTKYNKDGTATNWSGTSSTTKTGNPITVLAADVNTKCTVFCEVTES